MTDCSSFNQLYYAKDTLIKAKGEIIEEWISQKQCTDILHHHNIAEIWFRDYYANSVFDYFMGVVTGDTPLGQCPVIQNFIDYLKNQEIRSDELFTLCTHFKRAAINATYRLGIHSQGVFEAISYLFDTNFAGVLKLYTDTIYQKEQEAIEANKAKEYFLSNMSHEIRTPLNAILGFVALLKEEETHPTHQNYLDIIANSGENLLHIINDILDFSKLRSGEFAIDSHPFNIYERIINIFDLFIPNANLKNISILKSINVMAGDYIIADSFRIQQIVGNLLSNAIKFSPFDSLIRVEVMMVDCVLTIRVQDEGDGIAPEEQRRIFTPFYQASEGVKRNSGSGLGLSICKQLVTQMGGEITLESQIGKGSLFVVTVPVECAPEDFMDLKSEKLEVNLFQGKVLVAEDNEANQALIRIVLEKYGLYVEIVSNGEEAYTYAIQEPFDLILMDEQMPILNGHEAVAKIRSFERKHDQTPVPIVALSANVLKGSRERALVWGYDAFIGKPFERKDLEPLLEKYLNKQAGKKKFCLQKNNESSEMSRMKKALMLEDEQIVQLLDLFHSKMRDALLELQRAIESRDYDVLGRIAHLIKGSSANFRFEEFSRLAALIEDAALNNRETFDFEEAYHVLEKEYGYLPKGENLHSSK
ncbi:MAG: ATP-binding protein [Campylobacterales bacterium]|nr:ATP-binding protein [Campylobacterales bacterium]